MTDPKKGADGNEAEQDVKPDVVLISVASRIPDFWTDTPLVLLVSRISMSFNVKRLFYQTEHKIQTPRYYQEISHALCLTLESNPESNTGNNFYKPQRILFFFFLFLGLRKRQTAPQRSRWWLRHLQGILQTKL